MQRIWNYGGRPFGATAPCYRLFRKFFNEQKGGLREESREGREREYGGARNGKNSPKTQHMAFGEIPWGLPSRGIHFYRASAH